METQLALVAYILAVVALAISIYVAYLLSELKDRLHQQKTDITSNDNLQKHRN
jgi:hypothetical protein